MTYNNDLSNSPKIDDATRELILAYINAHNQGDNAQAEQLLHKIQTMREIDASHN